MNKKIIIANQKLTETGTHLIFRLHEPYYSAWKAFGWQPGVEGFGIAREVVARAKDLKKKIMVLYKENRYEITPKRAEDTAFQYQAYHKTPYGVALLELPRTALKLIKEEVPMESMEPLNLAQAFAKSDIPNAKWEELRKKLKGN